MKKARLLKLLLLSVLMIALIAGGGCGQKSPDSAGQQDSQPKTEEKQVKVALLLPGPVNDMGWNASAYEGLLEAKDKFGIEVAYAENVVQSDMEEYMRGYALQGFDIVIGHGFQFNGAAQNAAASFPETIFVVNSSNISQPPNLGSANINNTQQGFLMGAVAGLMTKTNIVGAIGGEEIPPIANSVRGFKMGAEYINPDIRVLTTFTGSFTDVAKAKETALAMIDEGADIIMANANQAGLGSIEACKERGILAIGSNRDQNSVAPDTVLVSGIKSNPRLISFIVEKYLKGEWEPKFYELGIAEGAVYLSPWHGFEDKVPQEVKDKIAEIEQALLSGEIVVSDYNN